MPVELKTKNGNITLKAPKFTGGGNVDLSNYYTKEEVDGLIPDVSGFVTADDVAQAVSDKVTMDDVNKATANFITDDELEAVIDGYVTKNDLDEYATDADLTNYQDFVSQNIYIKGEVDALIPDVSGFQTEEQVIALIKEHGGGSLPASEEGEF